MSGRIPDEILERIRSEADILEVVQGYVSLKRSGSNFFGLCPFHSEKTPSFSVSPDKQIYYCFGCHKGGDAIQFIMEIEKINFVEAITLLAEKMGILLPDKSSGLMEPYEDERENPVRRALELAAKLFHYLLKSTEQGRLARNYLQNRQITAETIDRFQLGYAPNSFDFLRTFLRKRGFHEETMVKAGLIAQKELEGKIRYYDRFRDRLMFPIHDLRGRVIGFGGRSLNEKGPKYLNSPESQLFQKGRFLFNFHRARTTIRKKQQLILFEGYMDVIQAWQAGVENGVATLGTALTEQQAKTIHRNAETVLICYDADQAGQQATLRGIQRLKDVGCMVKVAQMPLGLDPDDYIRKYGKTAFQEQILDQPISMTQFQLDNIKKKYHLQDEDQRIKCLDESIAVIGSLSRAVERDHYLRKLSEEFQVSLDALKEELRKWMRQKKKRSTQVTHRSTTTADYTRYASNRPLSAVEKAERFLVAHMMRSRAVTEWVKQQVGADFHVELYAALAAYLYIYYQERTEEDVGRFIAFLDDPLLKSKASELAMLELPETIREEELSDYVRQIQNAVIQDEIEKKKHLMEQLSMTDPIRAAEISKEIVALREKLKRKESLP